VLLAISDAMTATQSPVLVQRPPAVVASAPPAATVPATPIPLPVPVITRALLPGHWTLDGWKSAWMPPETTLRRVEDRAVVPGRYVWTDGKWSWVPAHYTGDAPD
jgi:hypothetical protein